MRLLQTCSAFLTSLLLLISPAHAGLISLADNLNDNQLIASGQTVNGTFNLNGVTLPTTDSITNAYVDFRFTDDFDQLQRTALGSYRSGYRTTYFDPQDQVVISVGGISVVVGSPQMSARTNFSSHSVPETRFRAEPYTFTYQTSYSCGNFNRQTCYRTIRETRYRQVAYTFNRNVTDRVTHTGYTGLFDRTLTLPTAPLTNLLSMTSLAFTLSSSAGTDAILQSATLRLVTSAVPEAGNLGLLFLGLSGLVALRRHPNYRTS